MDKAALSGAELLAWNDRTFTGWTDLVLREPRVLDVPCDIYQVGTIRGLFHHITVVELRYAQRLLGELEVPYEDVLVELDAFIATHNAAKARFERHLADPEFDWETIINFTTRSMGTLKASRRTVFLHTMMHSIRHYAQAATLVRQAGVSPGWPMDYLFMGVIR